MTIKIRSKWNLSQYTFTDNYKKKNLQALQVTWNYIQTVQFYFASLSLYTKLQSHFSTLLMAEKYMVLFNRWIGIGME